MRANIYSLVQEWNTVQHLLSNAFLDCQNGSRVSPISLSQQQHGNAADISNGSSVPVDSETVKAISTDLPSKVNTSPCHELNMVTEEQSCISVITEATILPLPYPIPDNVSTGNTESSQEPSVVIKEKNSSSYAHLSGNHSAPDLQVMSYLSDDKSPDFDEPVLQGAQTLSDIAILPSNDLVTLQCDHASSSIVMSQYDHTYNDIATPRPSNNSVSPSVSASQSSSMVQQQNSHSTLLQVYRSDLDRLTAEAMVLKECLPMVVNAYYISCIGRVPALEERLGELRREKEGLALQCKNLHRKNDLMMASIEEGRKELFSLKVCTKIDKLNVTTKFFSSLIISCM